MRFSKLLPPTEIHLHLLEYTNDKSGNILTDHIATLSPDEKERGTRFRFQRDRQQYIASRAFLRTILSRYWPEVAPSAWRFLVGTHGRPSIVGQSEENFSFNLSHTDGRVVLAVAAAAKLGVDIEWTGRSVETIELADAFFAAEEAKMLRAVHITERCQCFFDLWSLKEAYVKALGGGLTISLASLAFNFTDQNSIKVTFDPVCRNQPTNWHFWNFDIGEDYALSLALHGTGSWQPRIFRCSLPQLMPEEMNCQVSRIG